MKVFLDTNILLDYVDNREKILPTALYVIRGLCPELFPRIR